MNTDVFDVAKYILDKKGTMSAMKLQKLIYYCQAWSLVWDDKPLFKNKICAWSNGPVVPDLYNEHKGMFNVTAKNFEHLAKGKLTHNQKDTINVVLNAYGKKSAQWLSDQTHSESPWRDARKGLLDTERGNQEITLASLGEFYSSLK